MKLFKFAYKIIRNKKLLLITLAVVLAIMIIFPVLILKLSTAVTRANILRNNPLAVKMLPLYWKIRKASDIFYLPYYFKKNKLSTYELTIKDGDSEKLNNSLPKEFMNVELVSRVFVPAEFKYDNKTYQVKVRYRGDNAVHWNAPKKSYLIEFNQDDLFNGYRQLSFIIANDRYFALEQLNNYRAEKFGLLYPPSFFANLKINGKNNGVYFIIENWSKEMLAKWEVPDESNFYGTVSPTGAAGIERDDVSWDNLDYWQKLTSDSLFTYQHYSELYKLLELLNNADDQKFYSSIFNLIDQNNLYHWQALQELGNANHQISSNMRLYFNNSSGKFYFIPWDVGGGREGPAEDHLELYGKIAGRIFDNPVFAYEKNKLLYDYVNDDKNLEQDLAKYDEIYNSIKTAIYKDRLKIYPNKFADNTHQEFRQKIIDNFARIKNAFSSSLVFIDSHIAGENNSQNILAYFDLHINSRAGLYFKELKINLSDNTQLKDFNISYETGEKYQDVLLYTQRKYDPDTFKPDLITTAHRFYLTSSQISAQDFSDQFKSFNFTLANAITGAKIKDNDIKDRNINDSAFKYFDFIGDIDKFISLNQIFFVNKNFKEIILSGVHNINQTVIVPQGYTLKIMPGTTLYFASGASLISYSPIIANNANFLAQNPNQPWGSVAVINSDQSSQFNNTRFSDGSDGYVNAVYFSGMLSIYHSPAEVSNSFFQNARADDALNIKNATATVANSTFYNNSADAIDFDFMRGAIENNTFKNNGNDGIDLSGSTIIIKNNTIENSGDKCISIGEKSLNTIIDNNILSGCNIGVEIKDDRKQSNRFARLHQKTSLWPKYD